MKEEILENKIEKKHKGSFNILNLENAGNTVLPFGDIKKNFSKEDLINLDNIEEENFGDLAQDLNEILNTLSNEEGVQIIVKDGSELVGYLSSRRADTFNYGIRIDKNFNKNPDNLYIESVAGKMHIKVINLLKEKAKEAQYKTISMYGINDRLNNVLERFGFEKKYKISNFYGEEADYMEFGLNKD